MSYQAALRRVRNGQQRVLRLQRRVWLAELALWPTAVLLALAGAAGAWVLWQRKSRERQAETAAGAWAPVDAPEPAVAGPGAGH